MEQPQNRTSGGLLSTQTKFPTLIAVVLLVQMVSIVLKVIFSFHVGTCKHVTAALLYYNNIETTNPSELIVTVYFILVYPNSSKRLILGNRIQRHHP